MAPTLFSHVFGPSDGTPILIVHGWISSSEVEIYDYEPTFSTTSYRRIYIDLPGMGQSPMTSDIQDLDSILRAVENFIETEISPRRFLLVGSSCGAYLARALAYRYASVIDGLLLTVPVVEPESVKRDVDRPFMPAIANPHLIGDLSEEDKELIGEIPVQTAGYVEALTQKAKEVWTPAIAAASPNAEVLDVIRGDPEKYQLRAAMHTIQEPFFKPTLIVTGRYDSDVGYRDGWTIIRCYPRATFAVLDRASHGCPVDESERTLFDALVRNWLARVEEI